MKKNIIKAAIALVFIIGAIVSFNVQSKANVPPQKWGDVACTYSGGGCLLCDGSFWVGQRGLGAYCE